MGRPKKIKPEITSKSANKTTITLPNQRTIANAEIKIENSNGIGEITINKGNEGTIFTPKIPNPIEPIEVPYKNYILAKYTEKVKIESDINELLPYIYEIAKQCETCTEVGVRDPTSTYAFLAAKPKKLTSYDIGRHPNVDEVERLCKESGQDFEFIEANILEVEIEETDLLFLDTYHTFSQLTRELLLHGNKAKHWICMHDTFTFRYVGQEWMPGVADFMNCGRGLWPAIENFLKDNPHWTIYADHTHNNGLTILKRNGGI